jgi:signal transduction histidine kinase
MTRRRLSLLMLLFFAALAVPSSVLVYQAYGQLKWEAFYQHQRLARELTLRIDAGFRDLIAREQSRPISDYEFVSVTGSGQSTFRQRSPLSQLPAQGGVPGLLGYFQVDAAGQLSTPIVPAANADNYGIVAAELSQREQQEDLIRGILGENRLVRKSDGGAAPLALGSTDDVSVEAAKAKVAPADAAPAIIFYDPLPAREIFIESSGSSPDTIDRDNSAQSGFDDLSARKAMSDSSRAAPSDQVRDLKLEDSFQVAAEAQQALQPRTSQQPLQAQRLDEEQAVTADDPDPAAGAATIDSSAERQSIRIETFQSEVEPMEFALLDSGHFVLFRRVWHQDERYVQGVLIDQTGFIDDLVGPAFRESSLSSMSALIVAWRGAILRQYAAEYDSRYRPATAEDSSELLYQSRLVAPFGDLELIYTLARLPIGAGGQVIIWSALVLAVVLIGGCLMLLRLGQRQLALAQQQQDFVSAVSHELKTPLTSIRMYGEMLREGWADEAKRKTYYDFIFHEAERLTRLINNVLQLARLSRNDQAPSLSAISVGELLEELRPRLQSQLEASGFKLNMHADAEVAAARIRIDADWFIQIFINLVDNAVKFSANAENRNVDITCRRLQNGRVQFAVRDYGPGIEAAQMKKIFTLFYRSENELTRETVGTGIGLALVQQLASAMQAEVDVVNSDPGAEFRIRFNSTS